MHAPRHQSCMRPAISHARTQPSVMHVPSLSHARTQPSVMHASSHPTAPLSPSACRSSGARVGRGHRPAPSRTAAPALAPAPAAPASDTPMAPEPPVALPALQPPEQLALSGSEVLAVCSSGRLPREVRRAALLFRGISLFLLTILTWYRNTPNIVTINQIRTWWHAFRTEWHFIHHINILVLTLTFYYYL